jgi:adenosylcobinamide kinase/adenosylcobinamide-phosphate guanylyltransferase
MVTRTLILGGARSGKSAFAESLAARSCRQIIYIATASAGDAEMQARIAHHRARRPAHWLTVEEPVALGAQIGQLASPGSLLVIDCLTLWLSNLMFSGAGDYPEVGELALPPQFERERAGFFSALERCASDIVLVSNEIGLGLTPMGAVSRRFMDEQGRLNQAAARVCDQAVLMVAGLPLTLKGAPC